MTLVQRPTAPRLVGTQDLMYGAITANDDPSRTCRCVDPDLDRLIDLINAGVDQAEASRRLWSPPAGVPGPLVGTPVARGLFGIGLRARHATTPKEA